MHRLHHHKEIKGEKRKEEERNNKIIKMNKEQDNWQQRIFDRSRSRQHGRRITEFESKLKATVCKAKTLI